MGDKNIENTALCYFGGDLLLISISWKIFGFFFSVSVTGIKVAPKCGKRKMVVSV